MASVASVCGFVASVASTVLAPGGSGGSWWLLVASVASVCGFVVSLNDP